MQEVLTILVPAVVAVVGSFIAYKAATGAANVTKSGEIVKVDAEAYTRAQGLYESGIAQLESQIRDLKTQLLEEREFSRMLKDKLEAVEEVLEKIRAELKERDIHI